MRLVLRRGARKARSELENPKTHDFTGVAKSSTSNSECNARASPIQIMPTSFPSEMSTKCLRTYMTRTHLLKFARSHFRIALGFLAFD